MPGGWLPLIWLAMIAFAIFMYVLLDGFVLGCGILFSFAPTDRDRDVMMNSVAPIWDGNETWLVLGGGGLFAVFPLAYAVVLPALYIPFILMLLGLVFRGVAFEFRFKAERGRRVWDRAFQLGSLVAAMAQGFILGSFVQGFPLNNLHYSGGPLDWFTPFGLLTGLALASGYSLLGSTWTILKGTGDTEQWARRMSRRLLIVVLLSLSAISLWVPLLDNGIASRWFSWPNLLLLSPVPAATALCGWLHWRLTGRGRQAAPFLLTLALFSLGYLGLAVSLWPHIIPPDVPYWEAAAAPASQGFLLVGALVALPAVLSYTAWSYYIFRGKVERP